MSDRSYAILGTGAIGGFYGARLQRAGLEVHFLLHSDYDRVRQHGLVIESCEGDFTLPQVNAYAEAAHMPPCDVAIVALKTTQNHLLPGMLPYVLKETGVVWVVQNGLGIEPQVAEIVGSDRVLGGICLICSNKLAPGHIHHLDYGKIALGEYTYNYQQGGITPRMRDIARDFERAGIEVDLCEDLFLVRWHKLVWNIPFNGLSAILNATTQELMADRSSRMLVTALMREVILGAAACDREIPEAYIEEMLVHTEQMKPYLTSMKLDWEAKRPLEIEAIFGNPLRIAQGAGATLPRVQTLYHQLQFLDARNCDRAFP